MAPLARRLRLWPRLLVSLVLVGGFVVLTRAEPSVARAGVMAALSVTTITIGQPVSRLRVLALGVTLLVLIDPLLVEALGFRLSAGAALAIVTLAEPVARALPGPRWLAEPLAVTIAAQLGVAPFLVSTFGPIPLASLPANLLAVPAAGLVMAWGMSAGLLAGVLGGHGAELIHAPTRVLLDWIEAVAARAATAPLGELDGRGVAVVALGLAVTVAASRHDRAAARGVGVVAVAGALFVTVVVAHAPPPLRSALQPGVVRWHAGGTDVVVLGGAGWRASLDGEGVLESLRRNGVGAVDLLVLADGELDAALVDLVMERHPTAGVVRAEAVPTQGTAVDVGRLRVVLVPGEERLVVEAWPVTR